MKLQPAKDKQKIDGVLDGVGGVIPNEDSKNPWATLARGLDPNGSTGKRRRWASDTLGATPPRDGPWATAAADVAIQKPPKTRAKRNGDAILGGLSGPTRK